MEKKCMWYTVCPIKKFVDTGKLDINWVEKYCKGEWNRCERYKLELVGKNHPDNLLPDGNIEPRLKEI